MGRADRVLAVLFVVSGATGLAAQVVLNRLLGYVFGASYQATATILAAYMAGLSLGALAFGRLSCRIRKPIRAYALLELGVAGILALVPSLYVAYRAAAVDLSRLVSDDPAALTLVRFVLSSALVLVPTTLMGGTLPLLVAAFPGPRSLTERLPWLYAANTLGAAAGTLLTGYLGIVALGLDGTLYLCAALDAGVALAALWVARGLPAAAVGEAAASQDAGRAQRTDAVAPAGGPALAAGVVVGLAFFQGTLTFTLEVVWSHLARTVLGVTVHAYVLMLAAILLGIGIGSWLVPRVARATRLAPVQVFVGSQVAMAATLAVSLVLWDRFPNLVNLTTWLSPSWSFAERELARFAWAMLLMLPASTAMGAALPSLAASLRESPGRAAGRWVGVVFAANTLGAIVGSLVTGFVLLGRVESSLLLRGAGLLVLGSAALALLAGGARVLDGVGSLRPRFAALGAAAAVVLAAFPGWNPYRLTAGSHYYWLPWSAPSHVIRFLREDAQSGFVSVEQGGARRTLKTNGKYEGSDAHAEFQDDFALVPSLYARQLRTAALLGLGPGRTLATLYAMPFERIEAFEFSPAIVEAAREEFPDFTARPLADASRVRLVLDDGRNRLQVAEQRYDLIVVATSGAAFAGSGAIYSGDFFELLRSRLTPGGVLGLWLQLHHVPARDVRAVLATFAGVFEHVHVYTTAAADQSFLVGSTGPLVVAGERIAQLDGISHVRRLLAERRMRSTIELTPLCVFSRRDELERYLAAGKAPPDRLDDMRPLFEYRVPEGLALDIRSHDLQRHSDVALPPIDPRPEGGLGAGLLAARRLYAGDYAAALAGFRESRAELGDEAWAPLVTRAEQMLRWQGGRQ